RQGGGQDVQDLPGDLPGGLRPDPGGAGEGGGSLGGILLHRPPGERGPGAGSLRRPRGYRTGVQGSQRGPRGGAAAGAQLLGERGGVPPGAVVAHAGRVVGVGPAAGPAERPQRLAVGRPGAAAFACGQAQGVASGVPARGNPARSGAPAPAAGISGGAAPAARPRGLSVGLLRQSSPREREHKMPVDPLPPLLVVIACLLLFVGVCALSASRRAAAWLLLSGSAIGLLVI